MRIIWFSLRLLKAMSFRMLSRMRRRSLPLRRAPPAVWPLPHLLLLRTRPRPRGVDVSSRMQQRRGEVPLAECGRFRRIPIEGILLGMSVGPATAGISRSEVLTFEPGIGIYNCDEQV